MNFFAELDNIFEFYNRDWLMDGNLSTSQLLSTVRPFVLHKDSNIVEELYSVASRYQYQTPYCKKILLILDYYNEQLLNWNSLPYEIQDEILKLYNNVHLTELFFLISIEEIRVIAQQKINKYLGKDEKTKEDVKENIDTAQSRYFRDNYMQQIEKFIKYPNKILIQSNVADDFIEKIFSQESISDGKRKALLLKELADNPLDLCHYVTTTMRKKYEALVHNLKKISNQIDDLLLLYNNFLKDGKVLIKTKIMFNSNLVFLQKKIETEEKLVEILYEYIIFHGLIHIKNLLKLNPVGVVTTDYDQDFFKNIPLRFVSNEKKSDVVVEYLSKSPIEAESIQTIKQGRKESINELLKPTSIFNKKNDELSKFELITRLERNYETVKLTCQKVLNMNVESLDRYEAIKILKEINLINIKLLENKNIKEITQIANDFYKYVSFSRKIQKKYNK